MEFLKYLIDVAPSLAVSFVLLMYMNRRMEKVEDRICNMLETCMSEVFEHLKNDNGESD